ncbi:MAG: hypothetical protein WCH39_23885, partial [Schlesneria sp.]
MNVSVNFPAEIENALRLRAAAVGQDVETFVRTVVTESLESRYKRFARSYRSMNPRNFGDTSDVKFLKSRCKRFARSYRSMNPRNFGDTSDVKFLKSRCKRFARSYRSMNPRNFGDT